MQSPVSGYSLADCMTPLAAKFGNRLVLQRDGAAARWTFEEQSVVVELCPSGSIAATFIERPFIDGVSAQSVSSVYRSQAAAYSPTHAGCTRMISDMVAFFSGAREPRFTFSDAYAR